MLKLLILVESTTALQITVLLGGVAIFFAAVLSRACPLCVWLEWAGICCCDDEDSPRDS
jgi:hypothetical protein